MKETGVEDTREEAGERVYRDVKEAWRGTHPRALCINTQPTGDVPPLPATVATTVFDFGLIYA